MYKRLPYQRRRAYIGESLNLLFLNLHAAEKGRDKIGLNYNPIVPQQANKYTNQKSEYILHNSQLTRLSFSQQNVFDIWGHSIFLDALIIPSVQTKPFRQKDLQESLLLVL